MLFQLSCIPELSQSPDKLMHLLTVFQGSSTEPAETVVALAPGFLTGKNNDFNDERKIPGAKLGKIVGAGAGKPGQSKVKQAK